MNREQAQALEQRAEAELRGTHSVVWGLSESGNGVVYLMVLDTETDTLLFYDDPDTFPNDPIIRYTPAVGVLGKRD